ncbi:MAG TPA: hypothetical protein VMB53_02765 [Gaiellaceae bacterium]|nr:hypothetical protein [Gaiellaceae bacterium]
MRRIYRRQFLAYALGLLTATAGFAVGAAWAGHAATGGSVNACVSRGRGTLYLQNTRSGKRQPCDRGDATTSWAITGPQGVPGQNGAPGKDGATGATGPAGPAGSINSARSPNGLYTITLSNQGILLKGPNGSVTVNLAGAQMNTIGGVGAP